MHVFVFHSFFFLLIQNQTAPGLSHSVTRPHLRNLFFRNLTPQEYCVMNIRVGLSTLSVCPLLTLLYCSVADPDPGSGVNNLDHISYSLETIFGLKYLNSLRTRDPGWKKVGSGINIPDPQQCFIGSSNNNQSDQTKRDRDWWSRDWRGRFGRGSLIFFVFS